jgi:hypothetical protein
VAHLAGEVPFRTVMRGLTSPSVVSLESLGVVVRDIVACELLLWDCAMGIVSV